MDIVGEIVSHPLAVIGICMTVGIWMVSLYRASRLRGLFEALEMTPREVRPQAYSKLGYDYEALEKLSITRRIAVISRRYFKIGVGVTLVGVGLNFAAGIWVLKTSHRESARGASLEAPLDSDVEAATPRAEESTQISGGAETDGVGSKPNPFPAGLGDDWMGMVWIPSGKFLMGSPKSESRRSMDETRHEVELTGGYWMGQTEVTQGQYFDIMDSDPSYFHDETDARLPVEMVNWMEAAEFCQRLNEKVGDHLPEGYETRLPTEAEWEYACRGGRATAFSFGESAAKLGDYGWYYVNSVGKTHPVGLKEPNPWGLYDMHGNVWEWTHDLFASLSSLPATNPVGASEGRNRVIRGGAWDFGAESCRSAARESRDPSSRAHFVGFRIVVAPKLLGILEEESQVGLDPTGPSSLQALSEE